MLKHGCEPGIWGGFALNDDPEKVNTAMLKINKALFPSRGSRMRRVDIPNFPKTRIEVKLIQDDTGKAAALAEALPDTIGLADGTRIRQALELLRIEALVEMAEDYASSSRVIIFANFTKTLEQLQTKLSKIFDTRIPIINGDNTTHERDEIVANFQGNGLPAVLVNTEAGGCGIGLHDPRGRVDRTSLISPCWNAKSMKQVVGRPHRDGAAYSQQFFVYFADTYEAIIADAVSAKFARMDCLNDAVLNGKLTA